MFVCIKLFIPLYIDLLFTVFYVTETTVEEFSINKLHTTRATLKITIYKFIYFIVLANGLESVAYTHTHIRNRAYKHKFIDIIIILCLCACASSNYNFQILLCIRVRGPINCENLSFYISLYFIRFKNKCKINSYF